jgi:RNA polymerase sigma factor (sigma-70 family)
MTQMPQPSRAERLALFEQWRLNALFPARRFWKTPSRFARLRRHGWDLDDCNQAALVGLWNATAAFDPAKYFTFGSFAGRRAEWAMFKLIERKERQIDELGDLDPIGPESDPAEVAERQDEIASVQKVLRQLLPRERDYLMQSAEGRTLKEIAAGRHSREYARVVVKHGLEEFTEAMHRRITAAAT